MACGVPVVSSNVSSIPEIVEDAALLVNPNDPQDIAHGILQMLNNESLRFELIGRGLRQSAKFTWEKAADKMLTVFAALNHR